MVEGEPAAYLVRCGAALPNGGCCANLVLVLLSEKTICPCCQTVHGPWSDYTHSRHKADSFVHLTADSPLETPPVRANGGGASFFSFETL